MVGEDQAIVRFDPRLYEREGIAGERRRQIVRILQTALAAVDPYEAVRRHLRVEGEALHVGERHYDLTTIRQVIVVGAGKAGAPMAHAVEEALGDRIAAGQVNVKYGHEEPLDRVGLSQAGHPIPDESGVQGAGRIAELLEKAREDDLVICLISGGGSALMTLPQPPVTLSDLRELTDQLLSVGATIDEINAIRKHLDRLKGGKLARLAWPARVATLVLSDVVGNPLDVIASGPTVADTSHFADALDVIERYGLTDEAPGSVMQLLWSGAKGEIEENPGKGDPLFAHAYNVIVASNQAAALAAQKAADDAGFNSLLLSTYVEGEAREVAKVYAALAKEVLAYDRPLERPACLIAGGETTVTLEGEGKGGRNQEMALAAALAIEGLDDVIIACLATDGTDGPTDASGALADGSTIARGEAKGLDARSYLTENDSYHYFAALDDLLLTGPTRTNVNDLAVIVVW